LAQEKKIKALQSLLERWLAKVFLDAVKISVDYFSREGPVVLRKCTKPCKAIRAQKNDDL
jgi:hypothetical protein